MKAKKYSLLLVFVTGILCIPAIGEVELPETDYGRGLIGRAEPALAGVKEFYVFIVYPGSEPNKNGLVWEELQGKVEHTLKQAGIKYVKPRSLPTPELRIYIDMLKLPDSQQYVFRIQTSLSRAVCLTEQQNLFFKADVWNTEPIMQAVSVENMPEKAAGVVLEQAEEFIHAYLASNPEGADPAKGKDVGTVHQRKVGPAVKPIVAEHRYVASKNSKVFHKLDCSSANRIKPKNRIFYNSRSEAIQSGRRPCKLCKP